MGEKLSSEGEIREENGSLSPNASQITSPHFRPHFRLVRLQDRKVRKELFVSGKKVVSDLMVLYFQENKSERPRYAVYASKKLGSAVQRNRVKRVFREAIFSKKKELNGYDFIVVPREKSKDISVHEAIIHVGKILLDHGILR